ncbi:hypothetical protein CDL15_Pgr028804 [Punica granatum]|uniref:Uncharacterized protein n=1 Tax=Punica granatum TaxID=22663 RepID=A0A218VXE3_PUNGR|nr:hypothetical protein CDL15_Pgr028804 [Punica granatum]
MHGPEVFGLSRIGLALRRLFRWGYPGRAMRGTSSGVERLCVPRDRESESVVVLAFVVHVIQTSLVSHGITSDLSVPVLFVGVTHYGDLRVNFNQGCPSVRHLPRSCCRKLQPGMPQRTLLGNAHRGRIMFEVVLV